MSVGSQALERSALEAKDRDSLQQIAVAMGGKPPSRAKKADIVDMILELAGVGPSEGSARAESEEPKATARKRAATRKGADTDDADSGDRATAESSASTDATTDRTSDETSDATADATDGAGATSRANGAQNGGASGPAGRDSAVQAPSHGQSGNQARQGGQSTQGGQGNQGNQGRGGQAGSNQGASNQGGADVATQGGAKDGGQDGQGADEPGNRRRRRRGRDRDRAREGEPQPQGQGDEQFLGEPVEVAGLLDLRDEGYGFLRLRGYLPSKDDVYVSVKQVRQFGLRKGDHLKGAARPASRNEKNPALLRIDEVNSEDPEANRERARFEDLTPLYPESRLKLELDGEPARVSQRIVDLIAPLGRGQRALIVSPPKAGKTTVLLDLATAIETNQPELHLMVLLVDERPEEVTAMRRHIKGEVIASTFDRPSDEHTMVAELAIERAKRLVEEGQDVVIILDGITRLARAYNQATPATGRVMSGGMDAAALYPAKRFFGAARNIEEGGSLTIIATALVDTGSAMDEVIFEEFKGTANAEIRLDRRLAERRIYPAIDIDASSTQNEELLYDEQQLEQVWKLRRLLSEVADEDGSGTTAIETLIERLAASKTNEAFLAEIAKTSHL